MFITLYAVKKSNPAHMCGRDRTLCKYSKKDDALQKAYALTDSGVDDLYVEERLYADEKNLSRDITFDSNVVWSQWFDNRKFHGGM